ncbi:hypothetical protein [Dubosiella newyorkensis]|uniref:hypothetical protein n=1 Tax=Dubosiella newyorkensis TaxID=1862672 RepID=UPI00272DF06A|nr:hypothetical protein [Dubosiella newyorkensis]
MMTAKLEYVTIGKYKYPMVLSLYTIQRLEQRFGGLENVENQMQEQTADQIGLVVDLIHMLVESGTEYVNQIGLHPEGCEFDEFGNLKCLSKKNISAGLVGMDGIEMAIQALKKVLVNANAKQIKAIPKKHDGRSKKKRNN